MNRMRSFPAISGTLLLSAVLPLASSLLTRRFLATERWPHGPLHAVVEAMGAFAGLTLAALLLLLRRYNRGFDHHLWTACALLGMGVLDSMHASVRVGPAFIWLRSLATLVGGAFVALVWLPPRFARSRMAGALPPLVFVASTVAGILTIAGSHRLPLLARQGGFSTLANALNLAGGCCFVAATVRFLVRHVQKGGFDELLFANYCLLFGVAALLFPFSGLWDADWWSWHFLRLAAYLIVLGQMFLLYQRSQEELQALNETLEQRIAERSRAAETANRAKSAFLASMSHEIRTPMHGILGMTEIVLNTRLTAEQRDFLGMVKTSAESLRVLIDDILDFSKIEAGKLELTAAPFALRDSLGDTLRALALRAHQKGLELACHIAPNVPDVLVGDLARLRQIVINLVGNAIKFTERGEVVVEVEMQNAECGTQNEKQQESSVIPHSAFCILHFQVRDTGIGIPADKHGLIFRAFEQADGSLARKYGGTGLGLAISERLVEKMHGRIWVESVVGEGSAFHFTARLGLVGVPSPAALRATQAELRDLPVLVVDDNTTNRRILLEILTGWGMKPTAVESARAALTEMERVVAAGAPYPLILLDGHMPEMDGFALAQEIVKHPQLAGATLMMLSSSDHPDEAVCTKLRLAGYLTKPLRQSDLLEAILTTLRQPVPAGATIPSTPLVAPSGTRKLRILLAEDNNVNQRLACHLLGAQGHEVVVAGDGKQAVILCEQQRFDLLLMDVQMPEMDGLEAAAWIRAREKDGPRHLPIVAMTAFAMKGDRERCLEAGMDDYLAKPIQPQELYQVIERVTAGSTRKDILPAPCSTSTEVVDFQTALASLGGDVVLLRELIGLFLESCPGLLNDLRAAAAARDATRLKRAAHTIKGSVGYFSAPAAVVAAQQVERMARENDLTTIEEACRKLETEVERLRPFLTEFQHS